MPDSNYDSLSPSESLSGNSLLSNSEDEDKAVALLSEGATLEHYWKVSSRFFMVSLVLSVNNVSIFGTFSFKRVSWRIVIHT